jgi:hypothetical protein
MRQIIVADFECLLVIIVEMKTNQEGQEGKIEANNEKFEVLQENMWTSQEMKSRIGALISWMDSHREEMAILKASLGRMEVRMETGQEQIKP